MMSKSTSQLLRDHLTGTKVILRSNQDESMVVGTIVSFHDFGHTHVPCIVGEDGTERYSTSVIVPYSDELYAFLASIPAMRQWEILSEMMRFRGDIGTAMEP